MPNSTSPSLGAQSDSRERSKKNIPIARSLRRNQTPWERLVWHFLRAKRFNGLKFKRQVPIGPYVVDFCCNEKKLIIEVDGGQHNNYSNRQNDRIRERFLRGEGYRVLRFWNSDVSGNLEGVYDRILEAVNDDLSPVLSPRQERGTSTSDTRAQ